MKKAICFIIVMGLALALTGCDVTGLEMYGMPRYESKECYYDEEGFRDYTDFCKYYYNETTIKQFETHSKYQKVSKSDMEEIKSYFEVFAERAEIKNYYENYDFDYSIQVKEGDYFYIIEKPDCPKYGCFDVYYVDMTKQILYFIHVNS